MTTIHEKLSQIQNKLNAPKGQYNSFGKYNYRNCEDILQALKPILSEHKCHVSLSDEVVMVGNRFYIKATATITDSENNSFSTTAFAREAESKKGMDESQVTGSTSSYARKYALNGLFAIDDNKDADTLNNHADFTNQPVAQAAMQQGAQMGSVKQLPTLSDERFNGAVQAVKNGQFDKLKLLTDFQLTEQQKQIAQGL
nr:hypothetical protein 4 [Halomonadaceae bacterium]